MKKWIFLTLIAIYTASCSQPSSPASSISAYKPILMDRGTLAKSVTFEAATDLAKPGKICLKDNFIFVTEPYTGVHVFDNTDPTNPINLGFIRIPGVQAISVKDNTLFADNSTDLIAINVTNPANPIVSKRLENILPEPGTPDGITTLDGPVSASTWPANSVVVGWANLK